MQLIQLHNTKHENKKYNRRIRRFIKNHFIKNQLNLMKQYFKKESTIQLKFNFDRHHSF